MGKRIGLFLIWLFLFVFGCLYYYLLHNTNQPLLFYSTACLIIVLCLTCFLLLLQRYRFDWKTIAGTLFLGLLLVFVVRQGLDQRMNFNLQNTLSRELPGVILDIKASSYHAVWARPIDPQGNYGNETRTEGHFFPSLPYSQSEVVLADHPAEDNVDTISYRFIIKQPYFVDNKDVSAKYCFVLGVCSYFYKGYADVNAQTGEVIGLKIVYSDIK
ncbi:hypothetical protein [Paenibacillus sp. UNC451MF]|uniref:hypothetical protein n=1 Tax=Paenibacillus sp. UNC451MF TaxID=1449063 RepID=UPI00048BD8BC|nr:hypothetical protein [Paenibacillus sp. UNC451MF]